MMNDPSFARLRLGSYELLQELAAGGMATVYVARQIGAAGFERLVVIKRVHRHLLKDEEFTTMFLDESRLASKIHHPNVVPVTNVVEDNGELFLVMDYVDAVTLARLRFVSSRTEAPSPKGLIKRLSPPVVTRILADTLAGLHAAHEAVDMRGGRLELVHRDVSPQNILVGGDGMARLIDFGIAKASQRATHTQTGSLKGKYAYMSPEQTLGKEVDRRTDVFAAGVVLYEALVGDRLFHAESQMEILRKITDAPIPPPSSLVPEISPELDAVVAKALARDKDQRYATAADFLEGLERAAPIGSRRDVIEEVDFFCGRALEKQRQSLRTLISEIEPLVPTLGGTVSERRANNSLTPPPDASGRHLLVADAATHGAGSMPSIARGRSAFPTWLAALFAIAGIAAAAFVGLFIHSRNHAATLAAASAAGSSTTTTTQGQPPQQTDIELVLLADKPILGVQAPGATHIDIAGKRATVTMPAWTGTMVIEATLESGTTARATAIEHGPRELLLEQTATTTAATAQPTQQTPTSHPASHPPGHPTSKPTAPTATHNDINLSR
ncbi:MAG: serine/threonine-protein kinase [Polyangiaceae bacterium]